MNPSSFPLRRAFNSLKINAILPPMMKIIRDFVSGRPAGDIVLASALAAALLFSMISISLAQGFLAIALIVWLILLARGKRRFETPVFFWALAAYAGLSLLSSAASVNPRISFWDSRDLLLILAVPVTLAAVRRRADLTLALSALFLSAAVNGVYAVFCRFATTAERIRAFMGHYMTQAGLTALFISLVLGLLFAGFGRRKSAAAGRAEVKGIRIERAVLAAGFLLASAANILTYTRGAWIGLAAALAVAVFLWKPKALILLPVIAALGFLAAPKPVKDRALSIFTMRDDSNVARVQYFKAGVKIISDYPLLGTGPDTVDMVFQDEKYGLGYLAKHNVHLHSNIIQIAAERGLVTLAAWLAFIGLALAGLGRLWRLPETGFSFWAARRKLAAGGLAALTSLFVAGFFEYNFGDSEIAQLLFILITLPFAARRLERESHESAPS